MRLFAVAVGVLVTQGALAGGWTPPMTISSAFVEDSDLVVVYTSDTTAYIPGCGGGSWMFRVTSTDARRARVWATLLTAIASGQKVSFWYGESCAAWNYLEFSAVKILPN
jgi:hypothetical protein